MQVLLRHDPSGRYYLREDEWAMGPAGAHDFKTVEAALKVVASDRLEKMTMVCIYGPAQIQEFSLDPGDRAELLRRSTLPDQAVKP